MKTISCFARRWGSRSCSHMILLAALSFQPTLQPHALRSHLQHTCRLGRPCANEANEVDKPSASTDLPPPATPPPLQPMQTLQHSRCRLGRPCATEVDVEDTPPAATPPEAQNLITKLRDVVLFIPSQTLKVVNQGIFASGNAGQSSGEFGAGQKIAVAALAVALLIADQLGSSRYVISHAVEAVYGGPHLFVTGTSTAADNKLYEDALAAGRVTSLDEWYRAKLLAQYVESGQCPDAATSEWCARNAPK